MKQLIKALSALVRPVLAIFAALAALGAYDVSRNRNLDISIVKKYFTGNGIFTWLLSPLNILLDILALPYKNKGVYKLHDLPKDYQDEIQALIDGAIADNVVGKMEELAKDKPRTMLFFKWYGARAEAPIDVPSFRRDFKYIQTIGVSVFNKKQSTSKHFGPFRPTLRVLYNINRMTDRLAYIEVGDVKHYWMDDQLFIFDDTLMHQSFNETDKVRYCLFVDILRPSLLPGVFKAVVEAVQFLLRGVNYVFYKNWEVVK